MNHPSTPLKRSDLLSYGVLAAPLAFAGMPLYIHAPDYYATEHAVSLSSIGVVLLCLRLIDAVQDPLIGRLSDRLHRHRSRIILFTTCLLVAGFYGLFQPVSGLPTLLWFAAMILLATTAFSTLSINLNTLGGLWTRDTHQKTRITTYREAFGLVGLLLAVILPPVWMQSTDAPQAFFNVSMVLCIIAIVGLLTFLRWHQLHHSAEAPLNMSTPAPILQTLRQIPPHTRRFFLVYGISMLASAIPAILVLFFIRDRLDAEAHTGLFLMLYFLSGAAGMPIWRILSRRWNKERAWMASMGLAVAIFVWASLLEAGDIWQYVVICVLSGVAFGADLALPPSILADHIHAHRQETEASLQFGLFSFLAKAALAIASVLVFPLLEMVGFQAGTDNTEHALLMLSLAYAAIPCLIKLCAACLLWRTTPLSNGDYHHETTTHPSTNRSTPHA